MVDGRSVNPKDVEKIIECITQKKIEVLFSPVNLIEVVRCFENKDVKANKMMKSSRMLSPARIAKEPCQILLDQLYQYLSGCTRLSEISPIPDSDALFYQIREGILREQNYPIPKEFHDKVKKYDKWYINSLNQMKCEINKILPGYQAQIQEPRDISNSKQLNTVVDFYDVFNNNTESRQMFIDGIFKDKCGFSGNIAALDNFNKIPSFSIFLRFYFKVAQELVIQDKEPKRGDWADLEQIVYLPYIDFFVTSDTGKSGLYPNYRKIVNSIIQGKGKNAIKFSTLINKIARLK